MAEVPTQINENVFFDFKGNENKDVVFRCKSSITHCGNYVLVYKKLISKFSNTCTIEALHSVISVSLTLKIENNREKMVRGFVYVNNKEFPILECDLFSSLQLGKWGYDNITVCIVPCDIFAS